jgi:hypothetical protein
MVVEGATSHDILPILSSSPAPIHSIRQSVRRVLVEPRMKFRFACDPVGEAFEIDDFEAAVHGRDEQTFGVRPVPFDAPDASFSVVLCERDEGFSAIEEADVRVVAGSRERGQRHGLRRAWARRGRTDLPTAKRFSSSGWL